MATVIGQPFTLNDWLVEPSLNRISRGDEIVKIDPQNMKVLELLASKPGEVFSQTEIEQYAWPGVVVTPNSVYQSIAQLRRALGDSKASPAYIETIPRRGYRLVARVLCPTEMDTSVRQTFDAHSTSKPSPRRKAKAWHVGLATTVTAGALAFTSLRLPSALETTRPDDGVHQRLAEATDVSDVFSDPLQP